MSLYIFLKRKIHQSKQNNDQNKINDFSISSLQQKLYNNKPFRLGRCKKKIGIKNLSASALLLTKYHNFWLEVVFSNANKNEKRRWD